MVWLQTVPDHTMSLSCALVLIDKDKLNYKCSEMHWMSHRSWGVTSALWLVLTEASLPIWAQRGSRRACALSGVQAAAMAILITDVIEICGRTTVTFCECWGSEDPVFWVVSWMQAWVTGSCHFSCLTNGETTWTVWFFQIAKPSYRSQAHGGPRTSASWTRQCIWVRCFGLGHASLWTFQNVHRSWEHQLLWALGLSSTVKGVYEVLQILMALVMWWNSLWRFIDTKLPLPVIYWV